MKWKLLQPKVLCLSCSALGLVLASSCFYQAWSAGFLSEKSTNTTATVIAQNNMKPEYQTSKHDVKNVIKIKGDD